MYAEGHKEVADSLSTMAETLGQEVLTGEGTTDWDPGTIHCDQSRLACAEVWTQISFKSVLRRLKAMATRQLSPMTFSERFYNTPQRSHSTRQIPLVFLSNEVMPGQC